MQRTISNKAARGIRCEKARCARKDGEEMGVFLSSAWKTGVSQGKSQNISYTKIKDNQGNYVTRKPVVVLVTDGEPQQFMSENW